MSDKKPRGRTPQHEKGRVFDYKPAKRTCLFCGKVFDSQGPGNRACQKCKSAASKPRKSY